jgi:hypothetical protein
MSEFFEMVGAAQRAGYMKKPLHVLVAEALGEGPFRLSSYIVINGQRFDIPTWIPAGWTADMPPAGYFPGHGPRRYDIDWSATGPLIEKYRLDLWCWVEGAFRPTERWRARADRIDGEPEMQGETPLIAVCNLIVYLSEAGKLVPVSGPTDAHSGANPVPVPGSVTASGPPTDVTNLSGRTEP